MSDVQRHTRRNPCSICGGGDDDPRGNHVRCFGYIGSDRRYAHCSRVPCGEQEEGGTWAHRLEGECKCGTTHGATIRAAVYEPTRRVISETYDYNNAEGKLAFQVVRFAPKGFSQRRPDGNGGWIWNLDGVDRVPYRLPGLIAADPAEPVFVVEGEKDADALRSLGLVATTNPGGAGKWRAEYADVFRGRRVVILPDNDEAGRKHSEQVAESLGGLARKVGVLDLGLTEKGADVSDWLDAGGMREGLLELALNIPAWRPRPTGPWARAVSVARLLSAVESEADFLFPRLIARGAVTEIFSPRGIGKTLLAHGIAVTLARQGVRVLLLDRDNPPRDRNRRLAAWGAADLTTLDVMGRDDAPPLTDGAAWKEFPADLWDVLFVDSIDSSMEGAGEQDSGKPSRALAPLLDVARRGDNGPAVVLLGNCVRSGHHSRGSGVVEDRADAVFEVRDVTDFSPSGRKPWVAELPPAGAADWQERSARRVRRDRYRLALIPTKFRVAEEPEPFILELDLSGETWSMRDVTGEVDREGTERRRQQEAQAVSSLVAEIRRRDSSGEPPLRSRSEAEPILQEAGLTRAEARRLIEEGNGRTWRIEERPHERGKPKVLLPVLLGEVENRGQNNPLSGNPRQSGVFSEGVPAARSGIGRPEPHGEKVNKDGLFETPIILAEDSPISRGAANREELRRIQALFGGEFVELAEVSETPRGQDPGNALSETASADEADLLGPDGDLLF